MLMHTRIEYIQLVIAKVVRTRGVLVGLECNLDHTHFNFRRDTEVSELSCSVGTTTLTVLFEMRANRPIPNY